MCEAVNEFNGCRWRNSPAAAKNRAVSFQKLACLFAKDNNFLFIRGLFDDDEAGSSDTQYLSTVLEEMWWWTDGSVCSVHSTRSPCNNRLSFSFATSVTFLLSDVLYLFCCRRRWRLSQYSRLSWNLRPLQNTSRRCFVIPSQLNEYYNKTVKLFTDITYWFEGTIMAGLRGGPAGQLPGTQPIRGVKTSQK